MILNGTYEKIRLQVLQKLEYGLSKDLFYHGVHHTLDVLKQAERIANEEKINKNEELLLLKIACLYHDSGFLSTYTGHEEVGCKMVRVELPDFDFNGKQIDTICGMIMATHIPQKPNTFLEEIICDADLDYLGRSDFFPVSNTLFQERKMKGWVNDEREWNIKQIAFLENHHYFTSTSKKLRGQQKQKHLEILKEMI